jgi:hypothetical protein
MIRRLIRWLAREEIAAAYECGRSDFAREAEPGMQALLQLAYAKGEHAGMERAFDAVEAEVGPYRKIEPEDVIRARKRRAH